MTKPPRAGEKIVCVNKKARYEYEILETLEGGLALTGTEVKSLRAGQASITEGYAVINGNEAWLVDCQIQPYAFGNLNNHEPKRKRKILLHRREIAKLTGKIKEKGLSLIPLKIYFKNGLAKVEIGVGRGKKLHDKRDAIKSRDTQREAQRDMSVRIKT
jgi:SsrA-binding protein